MTKNKWQTAINQIICNNECWLHSTFQVRIRIRNQEIKVKVYKSFLPWFCESEYMDNAMSIAVN